MRVSLIFGKRRQVRCVIVALAFFSATLGPLSAACGCDHDAPFRNQAATSEDATLPPCHRGDSSPAKDAPIHDSGTHWQHSSSDCGCLHAHDPVESAETATIPLPNQTITKHWSTVPCFQMPLTTSVNAQRWQATMSPNTMPGDTTNPSLRC